MSWMKRHIEAAGMIVMNTSNFTIMHTEHSAMRQVRVAKSKLDIIKDANLRRGMDEYLQDLEYVTKFLSRIYEYQYSSF